MAEYALRRFEDVRENQALPSFGLKVTRTHIIKYVGAGGDFQPVHHDEAFAVSNGLPSIFANGLMHGGMLAKMVTDWAGYGVLRQYKIRFTGMVWPGDTLSFSGYVSCKKQLKNQNLAALTLQGVNQNDETVITGEALVNLPL